MTNLEKYPNTEDAVKAWNTYNGDGHLFIGFVEWCKLDYIEPRPPSLLEAAKAARDWMASSYSSVAGVIIRGRLNAAIAAEEARPKRNFERFATAEEAHKEFLRKCRGPWCKACRFESKDKGSFGSATLCVARWLYLSDPNLLRNEDAERTGRAEEKAEGEGK